MRFFVGCRCHRPRSEYVVSEKRLDCRHCGRDHDWGDVRRSGDAASPDSTRIVLDHTYQTYIAPPCYDRAEVTNNLAEGALKHLKDYSSYVPESACTRDSLAPREVTASVWLSQMLGIGKGPWDW